MFVSSLQNTNSMIPETAVILETTLTVAWLKCKCKACSYKSSNCGSMRVTRYLGLPVLLAISVRLITPSGCWHTQPGWPKIRGHTLACPSTSHAR